MHATRISSALGYVSIALGLLEIGKARPLARKLGQDHGTARSTLRLFGAREIMAGAALLTGPAHSTRVWNRVLGDTLDLAALGLAARSSFRRPFFWGATGFVIGATVLDVMTARALDKRTGKLMPTRSAPEGEPAHDPAAPVEPRDMPLIRAPQVPG